MDPIFDNEGERLKVLRDLSVVGTPPEKPMDVLCRLAQRIFGTPVALISLVDRDRQWFKARCGLDVDETPRDVSFCAHAILDDSVMVVENALEDARFATNPLVLVLQLSFRKMASFASAIVRDGSAGLVFSAPE